MDVRAEENRFCSDMIIWMVNDSRLKLVINFCSCFSLQAWEYKNHAIDRHQFMHCKDLDRRLTFLFVSFYLLPFQQWSKMATCLHRSSVARQVMTSHTSHIWFDYFISFVKRWNSTHFCRRVCFAASESTTLFFIFFFIFCNECRDKNKWHAFVSNHTWYIRLTHLISLIHSFIIFCCCFRCFSAHFNFILCFRFIVI